MVSSYVSSSSSSSKYVINPQAGAYVGNSLILEENYGIKVEYTYIHISN